MKHRRTLFSNERSAIDINVSPLIDVVFILLIFFIVTTVFVDETGVEVERPVATSADNLKDQSILIAITEDGRVFYGGREIGMGGVRGLVKRMLRQEELPVIIQADKSVSVDLYTRVHDEARYGGATQINLATKR